MTSMQPVPPTRGRYRVRDIDSANIREAPGTSSRIVGVLSPGTVASYDKVEPGSPVGGNPWWQHLRDGRGWVHSSLLSRVPTPTRAVSLNSRLVARPRVALARVQRYLVSQSHGEYSDDDVRWIARLYFETARSVGLDPLVLLAQMVHETAGLDSYWSQPPRRNPAGIGVTGEPGQGLSFPDWPAAVRAHAGRLLAYALPPNRESEEQRALIQEALRWRPLPDRYRGTAMTLKGLTGTWATDPEYAHKLRRVAHAIQQAE